MSTMHSPSHALTPAINPSAPRLYTTNRRSIISVLQMELRVNSKKEQGRRRMPVDSDGSGTGRRPSQRSGRKLACRGRHDNSDRRRDRRLAAHHGTHNCRRAAASVSCPSTSIFSSSECLISCIKIGQSGPILFQYLRTIPQRIRSLPSSTPKHVSNLQCTLSIWR